MTDLASAFERVFELAERGRYSTSPNPRVGAVVVDAAGAVVGEGGTSGPEARMRRPSPSPKRGAARAGRPSS